MACSKMSAGADSIMSPAFVAEFGTCLELKSLAPNEHFFLLVKILDEHGMTYVLPQLHSKYFLVHKGNRGGLLLSPHNCHKNAEGIRASGADLALLNNAYCMELPDNGVLRAEHLAKNQALIDRAGGLVPAINGLERFISLGCGHTSQFCKLAAAGGETPRAKLQIQGSKKISLEYLCNDKNFETMIKVGWDWRVVKGCVDERFPKFATIAQRALNTRNHVSSVIGELEVCMTLSETANDPGFKSVGEWKELAVENIVSLCAPCAHYASTLLDYVVEFGGGDASPIIQFVDNVAKQFQANVALGEGFWKALATTQFADKQSKYPLVRAAMMLANLTSDRIEDGIARLLLKSDVKFVAGRNKMIAASESEATLTDAMAIAKAIDREVGDLLKPMGQLFVRIGLRLTNSEKKGRECKVYSLDQIRQSFLDDISNIVGTTISFPKWVASDALPSSSADTPSSSDQPKMTTLEDHLNPEWICKSQGFQVGNFVVEKKIQPSAEGIYVVLKIDSETGIQLHQVCSFAGTPNKVNISLDELLTNWAVTKNEPPIQMKAPPALPGSVQQTIRKNSLWAAIIDEHEKHKPLEAKLAYYRRPDQVMTTCIIKPKELVLVPAAPANNIIVAKSKNGALSLGKHNEHEYFVVQPTKPSIQEKEIDAWEPNCFISAYWWVRATDDKTVANMVHDKVRVGADISIPVLRNNVQIAPHTRLCVFVEPKAKVVPLSNAEVQQDPEDDDADKDDDQGDAPPAAKAAAGKGKAKAAKAGAGPKGKAKGQGNAKAKAESKASAGPLNKKIKKN